MALEVAIQRDPLETVSITGDSTFALALEAQRRGHKLYHYLPRHLSFRDRRVTARAASLEVRRVQGDHFTLGPREVMDLSTRDAVLLRRDPPFDMSYITKKGRSADREK